MLGWVCPVNLLAKIIEANYKFNPVMHVEKLNKRKYAKLDINSYSLGMLCKRLDIVHNQYFDLCRIDLWEFRKVDSINSHVVRRNPSFLHNSINHSIESRHFNNCTSHTRSVKDMKQHSRQQWETGLEKCWINFEGTPPARFLRPSSCVTNTNSIFLNNWQNVSHQTSTENSKSFTSYSEWQ